MKVNEQAAQALILAITSRHTAGPWYITHGGKLPIHVGAKDGRWKHVPGTLLAAVGGNLGCGTGDFQEDSANAHLISAAPDGLKAAALAYLALLASGVSYRIGIQHELCALRDFIAKATDRTGKDIQDSFEACIVPGQAQLGP